MYRCPSFPVPDHGSVAASFSTCGSLSWPTRRASTRLYPSTGLTIIRRLVVGLFVQDILRARETCFKQQRDSVHTRHGRGTWDARRDANCQALATAHSGWCSAGSLSRVAHVPSTIIFLDARRAAPFARYCRGRLRKVTWCTLRKDSCNWFGYCALREVINTQHRTVPRPRMRIPAFTVARFQRALEPERDRSRNDVRAGC